MILVKWFVGGFVAGIVLLVVNEVAQNHLSKSVQEIKNIFGGEPEGSV